MSNTQTLNSVWHPERLGFTKEAEFKVLRDRTVERGFVSAKAREVQPLLYIAWLRNERRALKIGLSRASLWTRWSPVVRMMQQPLEGLRSLRPNEVNDREKLLANSAGNVVELWMTPFPLLPRSSASPFLRGLSLEQAEAVIDGHFCPLFGKPLGLRGR